MSERELRAGAWSAGLVDGELRRVALGGRELLRRLGVVVRDDVWGTVAPDFEAIDVRDGEDGGLVVELRARCTAEAADGVDLRWEASIALDPAGEVRARVRLDPLRDFAYNRVGLVLLHPADVAGTPVTARGPGGELRLALPVEVGPQRRVDGRLTGLFAPFDELVLDGEDVRAELTFEGDLFEMEDQRNWTDGSFKTYSTPLVLGFPHRAHAGEPIEQAVRLRAGVVAGGGAPGGRAASGDPAVAVAVGDPVGPLPELGVAWSPTADAGVSGDVVRRLSPAHVRLDCRADEDPAAVAALGRAIADEAVGLELAVTAGPGEAGALRDWLAALPLDALRLRRVIVVGEGVEIVPPELCAAAAAALPAGVPLAAGTDMHFAELNRSRPELAHVAELSFPMTPQVHGFDEDTLVESFAGQAAAALSARALWPSLPLAVGPITLRPRRGPGSEPRDGLPAGTDPRQHAPFAAAWTVGAVATLAAAGVASATLYETAGARGIATADGGPTPVLDALARLVALRGRTVLATTVSDGLRLAALATADADGAAVPELLLANLTAAPLPVAVGDERVTLAPCAISGLG